jgi:two-component system NtrC family response regulator
LVPEDFSAEGAEESQRAASGTIGNQTLAEVEERLVREQLERHGDNLSQAAKSLGISRAALYRRMEKYGLRR